MLNVKYCLLPVRKRVKKTHEGRGGGGGRRQRSSRTRGRSTSLAFFAIFLSTTTILTRVFVCERTQVCMTLTFLLLFRTGGRRRRGRRRCCLSDERSPPLIIQSILSQIGRCIRRLLFLHHSIPRVFFVAFVTHIYHLIFQRRERSITVAVCSPIPFSFPIDRGSSRPAPHANRTVPPRNNYAPTRSAQISPRIIWNFYFELFSNFCRFPRVKSAQRGTRIHRRC